MSDALCINEGYTRSWVCNVRCLLHSSVFQNPYSVCVIFNVLCWTHISTVDRFIRESSRVVLETIWRISAVFLWSSKSVNSLCYRAVGCDEIDEINSKTTTLKIIRRLSDSSAFNKLQNNHITYFTVPNMQLITQCYYCNIEIMDRVPNKQ